MLTTVFIRKQKWERDSSVGIPAMVRLKKIGVLHETEDLLSGKTVHILTRQIGRWVVEELRAYEDRWIEQKATEEDGADIRAGVQAQ